MLEASRRNFNEIIEKLCGYDRKLSGKETVIVSINANFRWVFDIAAHTMSDYVINDYVKFSDSGCQRDSSLFGIYLTYMHKT